MAKKKGKKLKRKKDSTGGMGVSVKNARALGTTIAGVLIGEIVETAVERMLQKASATNSDGDKGDDDRNQQDSDHPNIAQAGVAALKENLEDLPSVKDAADAVKAVVGEVTPRMTDVVDVLREAGQRSLNRSRDSLEATTQNATHGIGDAAKTLVGAVSSASPDFDGKKSKKKGKKKGNKS